MVAVVVVDGGGGSRWDTVRIAAGEEDEYGTGGAVNFIDRMRAYDTHPYSMPKTPQS